MTRQHNTSGKVKAIAGGILIGLGLHLLSGNLAGDAMHLQHLIGTSADETLGVLPSVVLAASHAAQAYGVDHQGLTDCILQILVSLWPLLLVLAGTILLRDVFTDKVKPLAEPDKYFHKQHIGCRFQCPSFDV
jgi:hypothetical protein